MDVKMRDKYICLWGGKLSLIKERPEEKKSARILFVLTGTAYKAAGHEHKVINATQKKAGLQRQRLYNDSSQLCHTVMAVRKFE